MVITTFGEQPGVELVGVHGAIELLIVQRTTSLPLMLVSAFHGHDREWMEFTLIKHPI